MEVAFGDHFPVVFLLEKNHSKEKERTTQNTMIWSLSSFLFSSKYNIGYRISFKLSALYHERRAR
jgi:hypothetical protein